MYEAPNQEKPQRVPRSRTEETKMFSPEGDMEQSYFSFISI